jgi:hypothetical protein
LITLNANGTSTVALDSAQGPYDGSDDALVGVWNNSSKTVGSLPLSGPGIFGLEGDGMCATGYGVSGNCKLGLTTTDPYDYTGDFVTFSITDVNTGTVSFVGGLAPGASTYFSLEGTPTANITVGPPSPGPGPSSVPEPSTMSLLGVSGGLLAWVARKRIALK